MDKRKNPRVIASLNCTLVQACVGATAVVTSYLTSLRRSDSLHQRAPPLQHHFWGAGGTGGVSDKSKDPLKGALYIPRKFITPCQNWLGFFGFWLVSVIQTRTSVIQTLTLVCGQALHLMFIQNSKADDGHYWEINSSSSGGNFKNITTVWPVPGIRPRAIRPKQVWWGWQGARGLTQRWPVIITPSSLEGVM